MKAPTDIEANKRFRLWIDEKGSSDPEFADLVRAKCEGDTVFAINTFAWTYDPRLADPYIPFILYPKQEELIRKMDQYLERSRKGEKINLVIDKCRAVGASCTVISWVVMHFFFDKFSARLGSRIENYVDKKGERDTLFYKIDVTLDRMPEWLLKDGMTRTHMMLSDDINQVSGESANPNFGRGGRKSCLVYDELGFWNWAKSSWESGGETTNFRIAMSTPPESGKDSHFYKLVSGKRGRIERFEFDWMDVPGRDEAWLEEQRDTKSKEEFAREILKSYEGTIEGKVYAANMGLVNISDKVDYDPLLPLFVAWDFGLDEVFMIWLQKNFKTDQIYIIDSYRNSNKSIDFYVPFVTGVISSGVYDYKPEDIEKIALHYSWKREITHFGDPNVNTRSVVDKETTTNTVLQKHKIYVQSKPWAGRSWENDMREKTSMSFRRLHVNESRNEYLISALRSAKFPKKRENHQSTTAVRKPIHDWTSHARTAYEYFIDNEPRIDKYDPEHKWKREREKAKYIETQDYGKFKIV